MGQFIESKLQGACMQYGGVLETPRRYAGARASLPPGRFGLRLEHVHIETMRRAFLIIDRLQRAGHVAAVGLMRQLMGKPWLADHVAVVLQSNGLSKCGLSDCWLCENLAC